MQSTPPYVGACHSWDPRHPSPARPPQPFSVQSFVLRFAEMVVETFTCQADPKSVCNLPEDAHMYLPDLKIMFLTSSAWNSMAWKVTSPLICR